MRTHALFVLLLVSMLPACGSAAPESTDRPDGGVDPTDTTPPPTDSPIDDATGPSCTGIGAGLVAAPRSYALPAARCATKFDALAKNAGVSYAVLDLTGDGRSDLVVYRDTCASEIGNARWDVYAGGTDGFAAAPTPYALPAARCKTKFDALSGSGSVGYSLIDLDADGRSDLVVHRDSCDASVGTDHWDVYRGGPEGFAAAPNRFELPAPRCSSKFDATAKSGTVSYSLLDLSGDGRPDLVVHRDGCDDAVGKDHWDLYANDASRFAAAPTSFSLPAPRCAKKFDAPSGYGSLDYALLDLSADGRPDLVVYADDCDHDVGGKRWDVYAASASGFAAAPGAYALPTARCSTRFDTMAKSGGASLSFGLLDLSCDRRPEIVVSNDTCDTVVGNARWDVYAGEAAGFAVSPVPFALPAARCKTRFDGFARSGSVDYALVRLGGAGRPGLVVTADDCDDQVGTTHWDVYDAP